METKHVYTEAISTQDQIDELKHILSHMIGVSEVEINGKKGDITITFETPANLNAIEKEIYDAGYTILY
ncbi:putative copper chaperone CsoZ [Staphylococcus argensis]|uniref:HMA domain-containing protein n=2 Tax=Staphylococcus argensis TaxID=1607738 RepID=A0A2K4FCI7_9STAP|nr:heavy metal-associated domain-containing protein [Staphylococcus argensis]MCY6992350.1 heavy-metal-associated domain-containing protein [Staphylococcus argensis]POA09070.1 hypothetical protein CD039_06810 [Staphylococcus argensis]